MTKEARRLLLEWLQQARLCWYRDGTTWFPPKCEYWWNAYCIILPYQLERKLNFPLKANKISFSMTKEVTMLLLVWLQQARLQQYREGTTCSCQKKGRLVECRPQSSLPISSQETKWLLKTNKISNSMTKEDMTFLLVVVWASLAWIIQILGCSFISWHVLFGAMAVAVPPSRQLSVVVLRSPFRNASKLPIQLPRIWTHSF